MRRCILHTSRFARYAASLAPPNITARTMYSERSIPLAAGKRPKILSNASNLPGSMLMRRNLFVQTEPTPNPDALKFLPGQQLSSSGSTHEFLTATSALPSPLATSLFGVEGVKSIYFGPDFIAVNKHSDASWALLKPEIYSIIIEHFSSNAPLFRERVADGNEDTKILETDSEVLAMIKELLETRVRPSIQQDGGDLTFLGFDEASGIVKLALKGSCRGCASSEVTLKSGIQRMLMHYLPEVREVQQVVQPEDEVAIDEFAKFEARLRAEGKSVDL